MPPKKKTAAKKKAAPTTAVAKKEENLPVAMGMYEDQAGKGIENVTSEDIAIPFLGIIQSMSPQRKKNNPKYIDGSEEGDLFNTVTGQLFSPPVRVIPCYFKKQFIEWVPRDEGGGFCGAYDRTDPVVQKATQNERGVRVLSNGHELVETAVYYVLMHDEEKDTWEPIVLSMSSTQLKVSRKWNTIMSNRRMQGKNGIFQPPSYAFEYNIGVSHEQNEKGDWFLFSVESGDPVQDVDLAQQAKAFQIGRAHV